MNYVDFKLHDIVLNKLSGEIFIVSKIVSSSYHLGVGPWIDLRSMIDGRVLEISDVQCQWFKLIHRVQNV